MSSDARQKLRDMGGIMASSPDLMQAVQRFQMGGGVSAGPSPLRVIPDVRQPPMPGIGPRNPGYAPGLLPTGTIDPRMPLSQRRSPVSPTQARRNVALERGGADSPRYGSGAQRLPGAPDVPFEPRVPAGPEAGLSERAIDRILADLKAGEISSLEQEEITIDDLLDISIARGIPVEELVAMMPEGVPGKAKQVMGEYLPVPTIGDQVVRAEPAKAPAVIGRNVESLEGPEATGLGGQFRPDETPVVEDENTSPVLAPEENLPPAITDDPEGTATEALSSLDKSYEEKLALFQKVFGDGEEDKARDRAMSLAMIGLAIAAGQSPNALTNIAQGAMVGLKAMGEQTKERQGKREKTKLLALDAALKEYAAQQKYRRELGLKLLEAGDKSNYDKLVEDDTPLGKIRVYMPTPEALERGITPKLASDPAYVDTMYKSAIKERDRIYGFIDEASFLLEEGDPIAGGSGAFARAMGKLKNILPESVYSVMPGADPKLADYSRYDVIMNNLASELAPVLLGESGRTISDGDRALVARQLGFAVDPKSVDGYDGITISGYVGTGVKSEASLKNALDTIRGRLDTHYGGLDETYAVLRPGEYAKIVKQREKQEPQQIDGNALIEKWSS